MKKIYTIVALLILINACGIETESKENKDLNKPKNVILLIGDGMGVTQIYAAMSLAQEKLNIERFKIVGFHKTYSASNYVTDSGAGGTALATGIKTKNKHISVDSLGVKLKTILEYAEDNNLATGMVTTSAITHATPASFIAHENSRYNYENIAKDFLDTDIDIFIGGGKDNFEKRKDKLNLLDSLKAKNYTVIDGYENFKPESKGKFAVFTAPKHNPKMSEGRGDMLPVSTEKAIAFLNQNEKGFFLMIEGSQIDWGGHDNDIDYVNSELIDFDKAIAKALDFAQKDGETLVIVTADHETGGLSLVDGDIGGKQIEAKFSTTDHSGVMVPVFAFGPGAECFGGIYQNTDVFHKMISALNLK
ncbi:MAG: alkaline phosphatase [Bacteroidales bacterium]|nr:alkaline phosphatase [Bacteroidales bacterium]